MESPIIITGCPRSGTLLAGRVLGTAFPDACLVTEHAQKSSDIPEDSSGVEDHRLWWNAFSYESWDDANGCPRIEIPTPTDASVDKLRQRYLEIADGRRLIIKNPTHILYPELVRRVFPDAKFVYCTRSPWPVIQSMVRKGHENFLLRSASVMNAETTLLHRAAMSWGDAFTSFMAHRDDGWFVLDHDSLVANPDFTVSQLCDWLGGTDHNDRLAAAQHPSDIPRDYLLVKRLYMADPNKSAIEAEVQQGCEHFGYPSTPRELPGSGLRSSTLYVRKKVVGLLKTGRI